MPMPMPPTIPYLRPHHHQLHQLPPKQTLRFLVQQGEIPSQRQARQRRDSPAHPFHLLRRQQQGTTRINSKRPTHLLPNLSSLRRPNLHPNYIMHRRPRFLCRVPKAFSQFSQWMTMESLDETYARVEYSSRTKLPATFKRSRTLRCPHPDRAQQSCCCELRNLPILSMNPPNLQRPSSRSLRVPFLCLVAHQRTRMLLPKIVLRTTIHRSSHFLRLQRIGSHRHRGTSAIILS